MTVDRSLGSRGVRTAALVAILTGAGLPWAWPQQSPVTSESDPAVTEGPAAAPLMRKQGWLYNLRERTRAAVEALEDERPEAAVEAATVAHDLDKDDPVGAFNLGTVNLLAGDASEAAVQLAKVAESDSPVAVDAAYNLGSAHHRQRQLDDAIHWYEEALRRDPSRVEAKINLELALQRRQQQQQEQRTGDEDRQDQDQTPQEEQQSDASSQQEQAAEDEESDNAEADQPRQGEPQPDPGQSPLPQFQPRPDMTAEEAASLLEAIEAMEREAREEMQPEFRRRAPGDRDW